MWSQAVKAKDNESTSTQIQSAQPLSLQAIRNEEIFQKRLTELHQFHSEHGHGSIPTSYPDNPTLAIWAANLRRQHILSNKAEERGMPYIGYLAPQRKEQLLNAGFDFTSLTERQFQLRLKELQLFKERYGHCLVPKEWEENMALGSWVSNLRSLYKRRSIHNCANNDDVTNENNESGKQKKKSSRRKNILLQSQQQKKIRERRSQRFSHLNDERIKLLEEMGFVWSSTDHKWLEMLEWAKVFGVVNYQLKMKKQQQRTTMSIADRGDDGTVDDSHDVHLNGNSTITAGGYDVQTTTDHSGDLNHTLLLENYHKFVHIIQDQSILSRFYPQDEFLALLSDGDGIEQKKLKSQTKQQTESQQSEVNNNVDHFFQADFLDYRIPPNDELHQSLRMWMVNQRSSYHRLDRDNHGEEESVPNNVLSSMPSSAMTPQRQEALEEIHFSWSGRFGNRIEEVKHKDDRLAEIERQLEKKRRIDEKERKEQEMVEQLTSSIVASVTSNSGKVEGADADAVDSGVIEEEKDVDIMALWGAEDYEDDDW